MDAIPTLQKDPITETVNKLKTISLADNIHKLTPPQNLMQNTGSGIEIVEALKADPIIEEVQLELMGLMYDSLQKQYIPYRKPVMNQLGIGNFIQVIKVIAKTIEFSSLSERDIPKFAMFNFKENYPYFTIYFKEYELDRKDFNLIATILMNFIISSFYKAKGAGHRNVVRGTYSEDMLGRITRGDESDKQKKPGFLGRMARGFMNPMRRSR